MIWKVVTLYLTPSIALILILKPRKTDAQWFIFKCSIAVSALRISHVLDRSDSSIMSSSVYMSLAYLSYTFKLYCGFRRQSNTRHCTVHRSTRNSGESRRWHSPRCPVVPRSSSWSSCGCGSRERHRCCRSRPIAASTQTHGANRCARQNQPSTCRFRSQLFCCTSQADCLKPSRLKIVIATQKHVTRHFSRKTYADVARIWNSRAQEI